VKYTRTTARPRPPAPAPAPEAVSPHTADAWIQVYRARAEVRLVPVDLPVDGTVAEHRRAWRTAALRSTVGPVGELGSALRTLRPASRGD